MVAAQYIDELMGNHGLDGILAGLQILTGVKVIGMLVEVAADAGSHGKTQVGVDIDLANGHAGGGTELFLGNADGIGHTATVLVD